MNVPTPPALRTSTPRRNKVIAQTTGLLVAAGAIAVLLGTSSCQTIADILPSMPPPNTYTSIRYLDQGWTAQDRVTYYRTAQGTQIFPYDWMKALKTLDGRERFVSAANYTRYRFLVDEGNPDGLAVGMVRDDDTFADPQTGAKSFWGLTCAACHTGQLIYNGVALRIDGGSAQHHLTEFVKDAVVAFELTASLPSERFREFADDVLGKTASDASRTDLRQRVKAKADQLKDINAKFHKLYPIPDLFGRQDALGRGGNNGFLNIGIDANLVTANAPVSYPAVWEAVNWDWVQYNASIQQPLGRNIGEVLGVGGRVKLTLGPADKSGYTELYQSSVKLRELQKIEETIHKLKPPAWPEDLLGKIDPTAAARGRELFKLNCAYCHDNFKYEYDPNGSKAWVARVVPLEHIGTDPNQALNLRNHLIDPGDLREKEDGNQKVSAGAMLARISDRVGQKKRDEMGSQLTKTEFETMKYGRKNIWRYDSDVFLPDGTKFQVTGYRAHSLTAIWATPPYLHNGSVPNLYQLLSPLEERSKEFYTGNLEYDPSHVGYRTDQKPASNEATAKFTANLSGNSNAGHEFTDEPKPNGKIGRMLAPRERLDIIEYLKTRTKTLAEEEKNK